MRANKHMLAIYICLFSYISSYTQTKNIDSLKQVIAHNKTSRERLSAIFVLAEQNINADSLLPYIKLAERMNATTGNASIQDSIAYSYASYYARKNLTDSALSMLDPLIAKYKSGNQNRPFYLGILFYRAKILDRANQYSKSLVQLFDVLEEADKQQDTLIQIQAKTGMGWVQMEMEQYKEALKWLIQALHTSTNNNYYKNYGALYSNLASVYNALNQQDSAFYYIDIAIRDARKNENLLFLATALSIEAKILSDNKKPQQAEAALNEVLEIRKKLNDPFYIVYDMSNLAGYYAKNQQADKGIALCKEGIALAKQYQLSSQLLLMYQALAENYRAAGAQKEYGSTLEYIIALKDSFNNINASKMLIEMEAKNDAQKKEKTILDQKLNLTVKNYWLVGSATFCIMAITIVWLFFKNYQRRQQTKLQLVLLEEKRIASESIMQAEEQERKRIAADLHDNIGAYASAISASIEQITEKGIENSNEALITVRQHSREIISSLRDTIWVLKKESISLTEISDRLKDYLNKLRPSYPQISINIIETINTDRKISSRDALNIFRIVQEAVHNALKHSEASQISVQISSNQVIEMKISDNGTGMDEKQALHKGNGLINMRTRAAEAGFEFTLISEKTTGTRICLNESIL